MAKQFNVVIVAGTLPVLDPSSGKLYSQTQVFESDGSLIARYNKIHLFDVSLPLSNESYRESDTYLHGYEPVVVETSIGKIGLAICYDLRFPELFRNLVDGGAQVICLPSAFTEKTGEAHWEVLLRARAIENQVVIAAANQTGVHPDGRRTFGHSCVIDSWGQVLSTLGDEVGHATAVIDLADQAQLRERFPVLQHRRV